MNKDLKIDYRLLNLLTLKKYNSEKEKIYENKDDLYRIANDYLEQNNANENFLNKPAVAERIKKILFENILLGENIKISQNGGIVEKGENYTQTLGVLKNGSVLFLRNYDGKKRVTSFDMLDDNVVCRYSEFLNDEKIISEKRIIIDEYGFDKECYDIYYDLDYKFRETFNPIISSIDENSILAIKDTGSYSISPYIDKYFLNRNLEEGIIDDIFHSNLIDIIKFNDINETLTSYPTSVQITDEQAINKIKERYEYLRTRYPNVEKWFINRFGKEFLVKNNIIAKDSDISEITTFDRIKLAKESEVTIHFQNEDLEYEVLSEFSKKLYLSKHYFKSFIFLQKMNDEDLKRFTEENSDYSSNFLASVISFIESDELKTEMLDNRDDLNILDIITVVETIKDEEKKVYCYNKYIDDIIAYDMNILSKESDNYGDEEEDYYEDEMDESSAIDEEANSYSLSQRVLDSLSKHDNLYKYIILLKKFSKIKYEYIKDFSKYELADIVAVSPDELELDEYVAFLRTDKIDDEDIIDLLQNNWEEGLNISRESEKIKVIGDLEYTFKVFALLRIRNEDKKIKFLEEHIDDFGADEITLVLEDLGDSEKMLNLAKKFELPKFYYYDLIILCPDDDKFEFLKEEKDMDEEDISTIISSINDMPRAFKYIENLNNLNVMQKVRILSKMETDLYEDPDLMKKMKFEFLKANKKEFLSSIEGQEDLDIFYSYIRDYELEFEKNSFIEDLKEKLEDYEEK